MVKLDAWSWSAFGSTYGLVFVMELLDNTQLIQVYYSSKYGRQWILALASWCAFACTGAIGASFSGIRELSEYATKGIELFFAMLLFAMGIITFSHSDKVLAAWGAMSGFIERKITKPFLYHMGEVDQAEGSQPVPTSDPDEDKTGLLLENRVEKKDEELDQVVTEDAAAKHSAENERDLESALPAHKPSIAAWKLFVLVFATVFVLELPDKTMLMIATLAQTSDYPISVFIGYAGAMVSQSLIALAVGSGISRGAEKFGEWIELVVGLILTVTGSVKVALMLFYGEFTIDNIGGNDNALSSSGSW